MKTIILIIIGMISIVIFAKLIAIGSDRNEIHECLEWQQQSWKYEGTFYLTKWQAMQCQRWNVVIDAKII